jgi:membrane-bound lytic murein transglycosylase A
VRSAARALALLSFGLLAACASQPIAPPVAPPPVISRPAPPSLPVVPPPPANARAAGIQITAPPPYLNEAASQRALEAFRLSCRSLQTRQDKTTLTAGSDWAQVCAEAGTLAPGMAAQFFRDRFDWVVVGDGKAFATGYYEPETAGSRVRMPGYDVPVYRSPTDLVRCARPDGKTGRGRIDETGQCVLYYTRGEIEDGVLAGKGLEIAWAADPVDLFFLEIQGSGRLRLPDGGVVRLGYDNQNGRDYVAIGKLLRDRGLLPPGGANMQSIKAWLRAQPDGGKALMRENLSYIFFRELTGPGPLGAMNVPVTPRTTVAADPNFVPLGAPVYLAMDRPEASGLWVAQDTGGAIKGSNRFDTFWGAGEDATRIAGGMSANGRGWVLLPRGTAARALARP